MPETATPLDDIGPTEPIMRAMWLGFITWALGHDPIRQQFEAETGRAPMRQRSGIEQLIDDACGFDAAAEYVRAFVPWATTNIWGDENAAEEPEPDAVPPPPTAPPHVPRAAATEHKRQPTTKRRTVARRRARQAKQELHS